MTVSTKIPVINRSKYQLSLDFITLNFKSFMSLCLCNTVKKINTVFLNPSPGLSSKGSGCLTSSLLIDLFILGAPNVNFWKISDIYIYIYRLNTKIRSTVLCLSGFELHSRWVPLLFIVLYDKLLLMGTMCHVVQTRNY